MVIVSSTSMNVVMMIAVARLRVLLVWGIKVMVEPNATINSVAVAVWHTSTFTIRVRVGIIRNLLLILKKLAKRFIAVVAGMISY